MNLLTFNPEELDTAGVLCVGGRQARHMLDVHKVQCGATVRVGALGGGTGTATVLSVGTEDVRLLVGPLELPPPLPVVDLILALPRPQTLKKVLQLSGSLGLRRIFLTGSARVDRSYFNSPVLEPENIQEQLRLGLEQGVTTILPQVSIHTRFTRFLMEEFEPEAANARLLLADPAAPQGLSLIAQQLPISVSDKVVLAVGPEGGWRENELALFAEMGFQTFNLGRCVLRVEYAVAFILGQVNLLRNIGGIEGAHAR